MGEQGGERRVLRALEQAERVLFLCSGNMIRSAFAELYARHLDCPLPVESAATTYWNDGIHPEAARALLCRGVDAEWVERFRPRHLQELDPSGVRGRVVLGMTAEHLELGAGAGAGFLLEEVRGRAIEIADPLFDGRYDDAFARIAGCVETLVEVVGAR